MNDHEYALMRQVEDSYWWYIVLRESVAAEVASHLSGKSEACILDAGCGTGGMMEALRRENKSWQISGLDFSPQAIEHTRQRGFTNLTQGSVDALPFADATFDVVVSLDVLYFEGVNETKAMAEFQRVLKPGGALVLNLPAFDILRGEHDVAVKGVRRYTPARVRDLVKQCGLESERVHCWNLWLFVPILCWRLLSRLRQTAEAKSDLSTPPAFLNSMLIMLARMDMALCRVISSPLGTSVQAVARKPLA
ncbi:MAG: class I SAM-dependent methyltransferase [Verrucomicrobia bacterium]|nr:class I SAM-dependent methyltransferase [Verrucomicrobiota bacterium]